MAETVGGIHFRTLSFGLDRVRTPEEAALWGFAPEPPVYGMRFPAVPVTCEYAESEEMRRAVQNRLFAIRGSGFHRAYLVNHHGGAGQAETLNELAEQETTDGFEVHSIMPAKFITIKSDMLRVGGHAGLSETILLMAFRPDLIDLSELPEGELSVAAMGILHGRATIEAQWNPRHASLAMANEVRRQIIDGFAEFVRRGGGCL
jgi:creatinine amidohydrolase/Fe(II)-dependent formamide hydrolase-like protein